MPVEFGDLPPGPARARGTRTPQLVDEVAELKARPHSWGIIARRDDRKAAMALASNIRNNKAASFKDGKYEAEVRENDGLALVWARYVGPN